VISDFRHKVDEIFALLGYYGTYGGNSLPTIRDNLGVISSRVKKSKKGKDGTDKVLPKYRQGITTILCVKS
jgi:hypothetical protein